MLSQSIACSRSAAAWYFESFDSLCAESPVSVPRYSILATMNVDFYPANYHKAALDALIPGARRGRLESMLWIFMRD